MAKPCKSYKLGAIECAVWANQTADGKPYFSFSFQKSYKDVNGEWQQTSFFNKSDLALIAALTYKACLAEIDSRLPPSGESEQSKNSDVPF